MSINSLSKTDNETIKLWKQKKDKPLFITGEDGTGKSYYANELLKGYHIVTITCEHIKLGGDITDYIRNSLLKKNVLMMISGANQYKALLIDDVQLFSKYDKSSLQKIVTLIKTITTEKHPIILICNYKTDKIINSVCKLSYVVTMKFSMLKYKKILNKVDSQYILKSDKNLNSLKNTIHVNSNSLTDKNYDINDIILKSKTCNLTDLFRICSADYSILSLNILENLPYIIKNINPSLLYSIYKTICIDDYIEYKYLYLNLNLDTRIFYACINPLLKIKNKISLPKNYTFKYNSYISKSMIQIHNQTILNESSINYLELLHNVYNFHYLQNIDKNALKTTIHNDLLNQHFNQTILEKQLKVFNYYYHKSVTKKSLIKILKELYVP